MKVPMILSAGLVLLLCAASAQAQPMRQPASGPATKPAESQPTAAETIDTNRSKVYESGKWKYDYRITFQAGTPQQGTDGRLYYNGRELKDGDGPTNNYYETPWGKLYNTGQPNTPNGPHGWMPYPRGGSPVGRQLPDPASPASEDKVITDADQGRTVAAFVGQKVVLRMTEGPGPRTPTQWSIAKMEGASLEQQGGFPLRTATFLAVKPGKTTLTAECRPWRQADKPPIKTFSVTVDVQPDAPTSAPASRPV